MKFSLMNLVKFAGATVAAGLAIYQTRDVDALTKFTKGKGLKGDPKSAMGTAQYMAGEDIKASTGISN